MPSLQTQNKQIKQVPDCFCKIKTSCVLGKECMVGKKPIFMFSKSCDLTVGHMNWPLLVMDVLFLFVQEISWLFNSKVFVIMGAYPPVREFCL